MVKNRGGENGMILPGVENGISHFQRDFSFRISQSVHRASGKIQLDFKLKFIMDLFLTTV